MIRIYGKDGCSACVVAQEMCKNVESQYLKLGKDYQLADFIRVSGGKHKSFPMIAVDGEYLGGIQELKEYLNKK